METRTRAWLALLISLLATAGVWSRFGVINRVPTQFADVLALRMPVGIRSDLYPRWLGSRELLLNRRDPYSAEVSREIQKGAYGREIEPGRPGNPKDEARFAYPLYVVFLLAPTVTLPFWVVERGFFVILVIAALLTFGCWMYVLRVRASGLLYALFFVLFLGTWGTSDAIHIQQLSLIVSAFLAGAIACYLAAKYAHCGVLLALAMIKPQLTVPLAAWLLLRSSLNWRQERRVALYFGGAMFTFLLACELLLPGWQRSWLEATVAYRRYTEAVSIPSEAFGPRFGVTFIVVAISICLLLCWIARRAEPQSNQFTSTTAYILACVVALSPVAHAYDQVFLLPAGVVMVRTLFQRQLLPERRILLATAALLIASIWIFGLFLGLAQLFFQSLTRSALILMLYSMVFTPLASLLGLLFAGHWRLKYPARSCSSAAANVLDSVV